MITVVIPVYKPTYLISAIESIEKNASDWVDEVIVVIDNPDVEFEYSSDHINIKVIKNSVNLGAGPSRNIGALLAKNRFISFLDSDDTFLGERNKYYTIITNDLNNYVWCSDYITSDGKQINSENKNDLETYMKNTNVGMSTITCRKELFTQFGLFFPKMATRQDTRWIMSILKSNHMICAIPLRTTTYRIHQDQISRNKIRMAIKVFGLYLFESEISLTKSITVFFHYAINSLSKRLK